MSLLLNDLDSTRHIEKQYMDFKCKHMIEEALQGR